MSVPDKVAIEEWYQELYGLLWAMAWEHANPACFFLGVDDIFAELSIELVKVVHHYWGKPHNELKAILIVSLRNRCYDLNYKTFGTHRRAELDNLSLDYEPDGAAPFSEWGTGDPGPEQLYFDLPGLLDGLSDDGYWLVMEILEPSPRMDAELELTAMRKQAISTNNGWRLTIDRRICQRALGWDKATLDNAWQEVCVALGTFA